MAKPHTPRLSAPHLATLRLAPDEHVLWMSAKGGTAGYAPSGLRDVLIVLGAIAGLLMWLGAKVAAHLEPDSVLFDVVIGYVGVGVMVTLGGFLVAGLIALMRAIAIRGPSLFVTTRRLVTRGFFGRIEETPLSSIRAVERIVMTRHTRSGPRAIVTDSLLVSVGAEPFVFGPSREIHRVENLLQNAVITNHVALDLLPTIDGPPAPAESHEGFFFCPCTRTGDDVYGPLFVGPRVIVRITETPDVAVLDRLYTLLGGSVDGEAAELALVDVLRLPATGHFTELARTNTRILVDGTNVRLAGLENVTLELGADAAARLRAFAAEHVPETSGAISITELVVGRARAHVRARGGMSEPVLVKAVVPDLVDPTLTQSDARTVDIATLSGTHRNELVALLGSGRHILFVPARFVPENRALLVVAAIAPILPFIAFTTGWANPCTPTQDATVIAAYALGMLPMAFALVRAVVQTTRSARLPFAPGLYVFAKDVIVARTGALRIVPLSQIAACATARPGPFSTSARLTLYIECEPTETCFVPAASIEDDVRRIDAAREKLARGDVVRDPLAELRRGNVLENAPRARAKHDAPVTFGLAVVMAVALGTTLFIVRNGLSDRAALDAAGSDIEALTCYAQNEGRYAAHVRAERIPHEAYLRARAQQTAHALSTFLDAFPDARDAPRARAEREALAWSNADDAWAMRAFIASYPGSVHIPEARRRLPPLALASAKRLDEVGAYAQVIRDHAGSPEAVEATRLRHARYSGALASLTARQADERTKAMLARLFAFLEAHDGPDVRVRFRSPGASSLEQMDAVLAARRIEPIAPSFTRRESMMRESMVYQRLHAGFSAAVPADVLPLVHYERLPDRWTPEAIAERAAAETEAGATEAEVAALVAELHGYDDPATDAPEIRIGYDVVPSGHVYVLGEEAADGSRTETSRQFVGFRVDFLIEIRLGDDPDRLTLRFSVAPPASIPVGDADERTSTIYELMCATAFDGLGHELRRALLAE